MGREELLDEMKNVSLQMDHLATAMISYCERLEGGREDVRHHASELLYASVMLDSWADEIYNE